MEPESPASAHAQATTGEALLEPEAASNGALLQAEAEGALLLSGLTVAIVVLVAFLLTGRRSRPPLRMPRIRSKKVASSEHAPLCILTLDGGGMKGLVLATLLEAIEERTAIYQSAVSLTWWWARARAAWPQYMWHSPLP